MLLSTHSIVLKSSYDTVRTSDFDYCLPGGLIAQTPIEPRDHSRLLILNRNTGNIQHRYFQDIGEYLVQGDLLVLNDTRVIPARLLGNKTGSGGKAEILLLRRESDRLWHALVKPGKSLIEGTSVLVDGVKIDIVKDVGDGTRFVYVEDESVIYRAGQIPLPPYIKKPLAPSERYQTVYASKEGSAAAPTAGLHFTEELIHSLGQKGVGFTNVTLHIGLGTFQPVRHEFPQKHQLHSEFFEVGSDAARDISLARSEGRRIISIGTTSARVLEQVGYLSEGEGLYDLEPRSGWADIFILPGHVFRLVDCLVTNFHLPKSTLLMMVSALVGRDVLMMAYNEAVDQGYRFYSFGDAMLIL